MELFWKLNEIIHIRICLINIILIALVNCATLHKYILFYCYCVFSVSIETWKPKELINKLP